MHILLTFMAKYWLSDHFRLKFNFLEKIIHSLENANVPFNSQEWDNGDGDAEELRRRMHLNWREGVVIIRFCYC